MSLLDDADRAHVAKDYGEAVRLYRLSLLESPGSFAGHYGLAAASASRLEFGDAIDHYRRALRLQPQAADLHVNLAEALFALGHVSEAVQQYLLAAAAPDPALRAMALRNLACIAPGDPVLDNAGILAMRGAWAAAEAASVQPLPRRPAPTGGRLRIAYYGSFFADRNWMKMYMGVLNAHDRRRFEIHLIVDGALPTAASGYRDHDDDRIWTVTGVPNADLAGHIAKAEIDVLIDLNGYSHQKRLPLLLHRAAPVQIAWNGMYGTTGFPHVDVIVSDAAALPETEDRFCTERVHRVPHTYLPFHMFYETSEVAPPPSLEAGHVMFGSLNSAYKLTTTTLQAWSRVLHAVPGAKLLVRNIALDRDSNRVNLLARFAALGIGAQRLVLLGAAEHLEFLRTYDRIDIALDAFPYNGGTTTVEALWQGVPVLTINGDRWAGRTSRSILDAAGCGAWVAADVEDFVALAVRMARADLTTLRAAQRGSIAASAACDVGSVCRDLESLYLREIERAAGGSHT